MDFPSLGLGAPLLEAIDALGYKTPTPIQAQAIPLVLAGHDLVGLAQTGTGKTASFILPMIERLAAGRAKLRMPRSLVLAPTRELAAQAAANFDLYGKNHRLTKALVVGGESMNDQMRLLERGVDVVIGTPGRLMDVFDRGGILLTDIKILVIDEADRMLDMGFIPDIEKICSRLPASRQTLLFSATMPPEIKKLSDRFLRNPQSVSVAPPSTMASTIDHRLLMLQRDAKTDQLIRILKQNDVENAFIFCNRKRDVADLGAILKRRGLAAGVLHGDMPQPQRTATLKDFKDNKILFLVCSDVAARGLDIKGVSHVINYDVPFNAEDYVHRTGRTGRAGATGYAITFATPDDDDLVAAIESIIGKEIPSMDGTARSIHPQGKGAAQAVKPSGKSPQSKKGEQNSSSKSTGSRQAPGKRHVDRHSSKGPSIPSHPQRLPAARSPRSPTPFQGDDDRGFGEDMPAFFSKV